MENASKALIMAGGMLIGIIIISIGVYLFAAFGGTGSNIQAQMDNRVIAEFNNHFEKYRGTKCTIHDIVSLAGLAKKNNQDFGLSDDTDKNNDYYVSVYIINITGSPYNNKNLTLSIIGEDDYIKLLSEYSVKYTTDSEGKTTAGTQYFTCSSIEYRTIEEQQRVKVIKFKKIEE